MRTLLTLVPLLLAGAGIAHAQHPAYSVSSIPIGRSIDPQVGGLDILPSGKVVATFHEGDVRIYDPEAQSWSTFATGLHEPLGIVAENESTVVVMQRPELTRISDTDGDGSADLFETLSDDFGMSGNYHEFSFGPAVDADGNYYYALNVASNGAGIRPEIRGEWLDLGLERDQFLIDREAWGAGVKHKAGRMFSRVPYRGWVMKVDAKTGETTPYASGFRSPNGLSVDSQGRLFVSDNQGDWVGTSKLFHVEEGKFYGHAASLPWTEGYDGPAPVELENPEGIAQLDAQRTAAGVWFPQSIMANSPTQPLEIPAGFGPFTGQLLIGEMNKSRIIRVMLEEVNGVVQGACTPFMDKNGLDMGINRFVFDSAGGLYVGHTHLSWPGGEGLTKVSFTDEAAFQDVKTINITPEGFEVEFLQPVEDTAMLEQITLARYFFSYHQHYGSGMNERQNVPLQVQPVDGSDTKYRLLIPAGHKVDRCYEFNFPMALNPLLCYTVREVPGSDAGRESAKKTAQLQSEAPATVSSSVSPVVSDDPTANYEWVNLLDGDSLALFRNGSTHNSQTETAVGPQWSVQDGVLSLDKSQTGRGGQIVTRDNTYYNFELEFEFLISQQGDSGIKYRVQPDTVGLEYQINDDSTSSDPRNSIAALYNIKAASSDKVVRKAGQEWNLGRIVAVGNMIQHWLNGDLVMEIDYGSPEWQERLAASKYKNVSDYARQAGPLLLQDTGSNVQYRNLRVRKVMSTE